MRGFAEPVSRPDASNREAHVIYGTLVGGFAAWNACSCRSTASIAAAELEDRRDEEAESLALFSGLNL